MRLFLFRHIGIVGVVLMLAASRLPAQGSWTGVAEKMPTPRDAHAVLRFGARIMIVGGRTSPEGKTTETVTLFDWRNNRFLPASDLKGSRSFCPLIQLRDGRILAPGGYRKPAEHGTIADMELFDPNQGAWVSQPALRTPRELHTATLLPDGGVLLAGGFSNDDILASCELFRPADAKKAAVQETVMMNHARFGHAAVPMPHRFAGEKEPRDAILVLGGRAAKDISLTETEWYDPQAKKWQEGAKMQHDRFRHTATRLRDGRILVTGGYSSAQKQTLPSAELYDPATDTFTLLENGLSDGKMDHTATLLADGRVLIVGGWCSQKERTVATVDIFDPQTNRFTAALPLPVSCHEHAALLLPDGGVLVVGGLRWEPEAKETLTTLWIYRENR
jgi:hypothetical protein